MDLTTPIPKPGDLFLLPDQSTIVTVLHHRALLHPEKRAFTLLAAGEEESGSLSYGELDTAACNIAIKLKSLGLAGKVVLMFYTPGFDFITAFFGCLYAGVIPAAAYPPRKNRSVQRIRSMAADCGATAILTTESTGNSLERNFAEDRLLSGLPWHATDTWQITGPAALDPAGSDYEKLAFLQYTSGSTGDPKGVMVSHRNIMYNLRSLQMIFQITPTDTAVHWVPQFHDLGLIFGILETIFSGSFTVLIPPFIFISTPFSLLSAITRYGATVSGQPDFAFNHCVDKIDPEQRKTLNLSTLRIMYSGAEPVRKSTFDRFLATFGPVGLKPTSLIPAYGMAESTLILVGGAITNPTVYLPVKSSELEKNRVTPVTGERHGENVQWIASNGTSKMDTAILIMDPETGGVQESGKIGEVWASGSTIAMGYWGKPALTQAVFRASPAGVDDPVWLRTGDLGFQHNGDLYITGRLKDLIIIRGRNFYPQDIEEVMETSHPAIRKSCSAAFPIDHAGKEQLALVAEVGRAVKEPETAGIFESIVAAVSREFEIQPYRITLIRTGSIIKTSSGKIMRRANREALLIGKANIVAEKFFTDDIANPEFPSTGESTELEHFMVAWATVRLNKGIPADPSKSLIVYGIDSLRAVELSEEIKNVFGFEWPPSQFFDEISITRLAEEGKRMMEEG
jgi:acyl-CoA synthetase (AMP-forming)/AMP-acid ligase II/acyl carrier protein